MQRFSRITRTRLLPVALMMLTLAACQRPVEQPSFINQELAGLDFAPPPGAGADPRRTTADRGFGERPLPESEIYPGGDGVRAAPEAAERAQRIGDDVQVNFDGAQIREVVDVILGDILGASYTIDPAVGGEVVISSSGPLDRQTLLALLETALRMQGATLIRRGEAYSVVLIDEAGGSAEVTPLGNGEPPLVQPGAGISVIPLRYMSATAASQFVQPLVSLPEQIRIDEQRNLLLVAGSAAERQTVVDTLSDIDVNWMAGRSVGIFPLQMSTPEALIGELEALFSPIGAPDLGADTVRFLPMARLNAVLAIASEQGQIVEIERWVRRLDRGRSTGTQFFVYQLEHKPAEEMAELLNETFGDGDLATDEEDEDPFAQAFDGEEAFGEDQFADEGGGFEDEFAPEEFGGPPAFEEGPAVGGGGAVGPVRVVANESSNALLIRATPRTYEMIETTIRRLDAPPSQVLIEASIAEVALTDQLRFGVQYFLESSGVRLGFNTTTPAPNGIINPNALEPFARLPGFNFVFTGGSANITIDALSRITDVKILSSPSLVVQDNSEAVLTVGDEIPIVTRSAVGIEDVDSPIVNNIEYRETGVILEVKPRISSNEIVALQIAQEVSRVASETAIAADTLTPTIQQRKITSNINVTSGQTVVLGGLIQDDESITQERVPVLGDIPILGNLFRSTNNEDRRTELIVFITPRIIRNAEDARRVSEEIRSRMRAAAPPATPPGALEDPGAVEDPGDETLPLPPADEVPEPQIERPQPEVGAPRPLADEEEPAPEVPAGDAIIVEPIDLPRQRPEEPVRPSPSAGEPLRVRYDASRVLIPTERPISGSGIIPSARPGSSFDL